MPTHPQIRTGSPVYEHSNDPNSSVAEPLRDLSSHSAMRSKRSPPWPRDGKLQNGVQGCQDTGTCVKSENMSEWLLSPRCPARSTSYKKDIPTCRHCLTAQRLALGPWLFKLGAEHGATSRRFLVRHEALSDPLGGVWRVQRYPWHANCLVSLKGG